MKHRCLLLIGVLSIFFLGACKEYPYFDPKDTGYNITNDEKPWFDGKDYPYFSDMFDGKSIKPQELGSYMEFPSESVPVGFELGKVHSIYDAFVPVGAEREVRPKNPTKATSESIVRGQWLFNTYCAVCHGRDGMANTPVTQKGMPAPPIGPLLPVLTEPHLYNKIRYGSAYSTEKLQLIPGTMPPFGGQTSVADRWDLVNYMKSSQFGKEIN